MWFKKLLRFLYRINDMITIPLGVVLVHYMERGVTYFFPGTTAYDPGFYYDLGYSISAIFIIHGISSILFKLKWSGSEYFANMSLESIFQGLDPYKRFKWSVVIFFLYVFAFIFTFMAISGAAI